MGFTHNVSRGSQREEKRYGKLFKQETIKLTLVWSNSDCKSKKTNASIT